MLVLGLPYACSPVYRFPTPTPFSGPRLYNPYASAPGRWQRANLHAHGRSWGGLTNGDQTSEEVALTYRALGYDLAGVSNYHSIAAHRGVDTLPLYEHGYNVSKRHQLAIGARRVDWMDFPLWQGLSQAQFIINRVAGTTALVGLTHPDTRDAYSSQDLRYLTGYHLIEIVNGPFEALVPWDAALSSGHAVWGMANDDTHDTTDPKRTARAWTMIGASTPDESDVVSAMRSGLTYAVERMDDGPAVMDARLREVTLDGETMTVVIEGDPAEIEFVGQQGTPRTRVERAHRASYRFTPQDTYVRAVVRTPHTRLFLNPVLRTGADGRLPAAHATTDPFRTWILRAGTLATLAAAAVWLWPQRRRLGTELRRAAPANPMQETD